MVGEVIVLPKKLVMKARRRGVDLEDMVLETLSKHLGLGPNDLVEARLELARKYLGEGEKLVDKDAVQASEKLYKAAEECVKALAVHLGVREVLDRVRERGRWSAGDLDKAVRIIARRIGSWVLDAWDHAWALHVWGFHESKLDSEAVKERMTYIMRLVDEAVKKARSGS